MSRFQVVKINLTNPPEFVFSVDGETKFHGPERDCFLFGMGFMEQAIATADDKVKRAKMLLNSVY